MFGQDTKFIPLQFGMRNPSQDAIVQNVENEGSIGTPDGHGYPGSIYPWFGGLAT